jgi:hypothetical protein
VLDAEGKQPAFLTEHDGEGIAATLTFLEQRFGALTQMPVPCGMSMEPPR